MKFWTLICAALVILSAIGTVLTYTAKGGDRIQILSRGELVYEGASRAVGEEICITVGEGDKTNTVIIDEKGVYIASASCEGCDCVNMGYLKSAYMPLVCLPNELIVKFVSADDGIDSVSK